MIRRLLTAAADAAKFLPHVRIQQPRVQLYPDQDRNRARWYPDCVVTAATQAGLDLGRYEIEEMGRPHEPPKFLPAGKMAVYVFTAPWAVLKVGMVYARNNARYTHQHYNPDSCQSNLALSILKDRGWPGPALDRHSVGGWIRRNCRRDNILLDADLGRATVGNLEDWLIYHLEPRYEGGLFRRDRLSELRRSVRKHGWRFR